MRILKKYIIREHIKPFFLGLSVFGFILFMGNISTLMKLIFTQKVEAITAFKLLSCLVPVIASYSIPMAVLLASLLAYGRLGSDNEIAALRASGINPVSLIVPGILSALIISLLSVRLNDTIVPKANSLSRELLSELAERRPSFLFQERTIIEDFPSYVIYIRAKKGEKLEGIHISQMKGENVLASIVAEKAEIVENSENGSIKLKLIHGTIDEADLTEPLAYHRVNFNLYWLVLPLPDRERFLASKRPRDMTMKELEEKIAVLKSKKMDITPLLTELNRKLSLSFASLSFALIAGPLAMKGRKGAPSTGFGISLVVIILYYVLFTSCEVLAERGTLRPSFMWTPNIFTALTGCILMWKCR